LDALLSMFGPHPQPNIEAQRWVERFVMADDKKWKEMEEMEGYDELEERFVSRPSLRARLKGLTPEQRLAGLAPEQRVADLSIEERLLLMPDEVLRLLPDAYLDTLCTPTRETIRRRIGR